MTTPKFDQDYWEQLWSKTLREHADKVASRPPNAHLMAEVADLPPGRALDAGCGHGADTLRLAARMAGHGGGFLGRGVGSGAVEADRMRVAAELLGSLEGPPVAGRA